MGLRRDGEHLTLLEDPPGRSLEELLVAVRTRLGCSLNNVELLTVAAPFCAPLLELVRDDLREALSCMKEAEELERYAVRLLAGPFPVGASFGGDPE